MNRFLFKSNEKSGYYFDGVILDNIDTPFQNIKVINTTEIGKILLIDNYIQIAEFDEFIYQELITHPGCELLSSMNNALIVGGGDGLVARELLKYPFQNIDLVEIDKEVSNMTEKHFSHLLGNTFKNKKLNRYYQDALTFNNGILYDFICLDLNDPTEDSNSKNLFQEQFYEMSSQMLTDNGVLSVQITCPYTLKNVFLSSIKLLKQKFKNIFIYGYYIRSYGTYNFFALCTNQNISFEEYLSIEPKDLDFKFYNSDTKFSSFRQPKHIKQIFMEVI